MKYCPRCDAPSEVIDSRERTDGVIRRRRKCTVCPARWTTLERIVFGSLNMKKTVRKATETGSGK